MIWDIHIIGWVRPIIAGPESPTQRLSELLEKILSPLVPFVKSFIKDDWGFLRKLPQEIDFDCDIYSVDIVSLYTNIPHDLGIEAISYYVDKFRDKIPERFTKEFIIESLLFVLQNNNFVFDNVLYHQIIGTAMGTKCAPPYANLSVGYLEETKLEPELPKHFAPPIVELLIRWFLRYIDDGFVLWPCFCNINTFFQLLNSLNQHIQFTLEKSTKYYSDGHHVQELAFLDVLVIVRNHRVFSTDIYYKETNSHFYLDYKSHHLEHVKNNLPYTLAKKIITFVSDEKQTNFRLQQMRQWLLKCKYPNEIINIGIFNAKLQGPAPPPKDPNNQLIFVSKYIGNYSNKSTVQQINNLLQNTNSERLNSVFKDCNAIIAHQQPPNLLRRISKALFTTIPPPIEENNAWGIFKCKRATSNCKICKLDLHTRMQVLHLFKRCRMGGEISHRLP